MSDRLLIRHFLARVLDNDTISPDADRAQLAAVVGSALVTSGLFMAVLLSPKYLLRPLQSPGWTAATALDDTLFFVGTSMLVMALLTALAWDAMATDTIDGATFALLPIPWRSVANAKLAAVGMCAAACVAALSVAAGILHPLLITGRLPLATGSILALVAARVFSLMAAGLFGVFAVFGFREGLRLVIGIERFERWSAALQACVVVGLVSATPLLAALSSRVVDSPLLERPLARYMIPPYWFLGLNEWLGGYRVERLPRADLPPGFFEAENSATTLYRSHLPLFHDLAMLALIGLAGAAVVAIASYWWNNRRPPTAVARHVAHRYQFLEAAMRLTDLLCRGPEAKASARLALRAIQRSARHRLIMASFVAVGLGVGIATLAQTNRVYEVAAVPTSLLGLQTLITTMVLIGLRQTIRVPADLSANWIFRLLWSGDERPYIAGVRTVAFVGWTLPSLVALLPVHAVLLGWRIAVVHLAFGVLVALALRDVLFFGYRKVPLASAYIPVDGLSGIVPVVIVVGLLAIRGTAVCERAALDSRQGIAILLGAAAAIAGLVRMADVVQRRTRRFVDLNEAPAPATQRFDLTDF
jgi:hypothetical protein